MIKLNLDTANRSIIENKLNGDKNLKDYCIALVENSKSSVRADLSQFEKDISAIRIENGKYHIRAINQVEELKQEFEYFHREKEKLNIEWQKEIKMLTEFNEKFNGFKKQFKVSEKSRGDIVKSILVTKLNNL